MKKLVLYSMLIGVIMVFTSCGSDSQIGGSLFPELRYIPFEDTIGVRYIDTRTGEYYGDYFNSAGLYFDGYAYVRQARNDSLIVIDRNQRPMTKDKVIFNEPYVDFSGTYAQEIVNWFNLQENGFMAYSEEYYFGEERKVSYGLVDSNGDTILKNLDGIYYEDGEYFTKQLPPLYCIMDAVEKGSIPVKIDGKWGFVDTKGNFIVRPQFSFIIPDGDRYFVNKVEMTVRYVWGIDGYRHWIHDSINHFGWCNADGKYVVAQQFNEACPFMGANIAAVADDDGWNLIDRDGNFILRSHGDNDVDRKQDDDESLDIEDVDNIFPFFSSGLALARDMNKDLWGAIDCNGMWAVEPQFAAVLPYYPFCVAIAQDLSGDWGIIDEQGKWISPMFDAIAPISANMFVAHDIEGDCIIDLNGDYLVPIIKGRYASPFVWSWAREFYTLYCDINIEPFFDMY